MQEQTQVATDAPGQANKMDPSRQPDNNAIPQEQKANVMNEPIPHVGQPLDGRHYLDVLEEQAHADQRPQPDGENPRHPDHDNGSKH